jgi:hypothetical protein
MRDDRPYFSEHGIPYDEWVLACEIANQGWLDQMAEKRGHVRLLSFSPDDAEAYALKWGRRASKTLLRGDRRR